MDFTDHVAINGAQTLMTKNRTYGWIALVVAATALAYWAPSLESDLVSPTAAVQKRNTSSPASADAAGVSGAGQNTTLLKIKSRSEVQDISNSFAAQQWTPPVKAVAVRARNVASQPDASPQAPALPFRFLGRYIEDGQTIVFLAFNEQNLAVKVGDTLQQTYKVQAVTTSAMTLVYLPLNQTQILDIGPLP